MSEPRDNKLRELKITSAKRALSMEHILDADLPVMELREEAMRLRQLAVDLGPFDIAYDMTAKMRDAIEKLLFYLHCKDRGYSEPVERRLKDWVLPHLGLELMQFDHDGAIDRAVEYHEMARQAEDPRYRRMYDQRSEACLELAKLLRG